MGKNRAYYVQMNQQIINVNVTAVKQIWLVILHMQSFVLLAAVSEAADFPSFI